MAKTTDTQDLLKILSDWQAENDTNVIDFKACSVWANETGRYQKPPIPPEKQCEAELRRVVKRATYTNARGEKIRIYGAARLSYLGEQLPLFYVDMRIAKPDVAKDVFDHNYERIKNDVRRHSIEKQSYDDFNPYAAQLPFYDYDFNQSAEDARMTGEYDDSYEEDDLDPDSDSDSDPDSD